MQTEADMEAQAKTNIIKYIFLSLLLFAVLSLSSCTPFTNEEKRLRLEGIESFEGGDYQAAIESFDKALSQRKGDKLGKTEMDILRYRAEAEWQLKDYSAAAHTYSLLLDSDEKNTEYKAMLIIALSKSGEDTDRALDLFKGMDNNADDTEYRAAMLALTDALISDDTAEDKRDAYIEEALNICSAALGNKENADPELYNKLGMIYYKKEDYDAALDAFESGLALVENNSEDTESLHKILKFNEACCYEKKAEFSKALELFEEYVSSFGSDDRAMHEIEFLKTRVD